MSHQIHRLEMEIQASDSAFIGGYRFLESVIQEINDTYGYSLTVLEASQLVKSNLNQFTLSADAKEYLLQLIDMIELQADLRQDHINVASDLQLTTWNFYAPWNWNWFGWNKRNANKHAYSLGHKGHAVSLINEPPDALIFGLVEMFAGALLCIIPHPITHTIGAGLLTHGVMQTFGAAADESIKNKQQLPIQ